MSIYFWENVFENFQMDHTKPPGYAKWNTVYPLYLDKKKTKSEGRRLPAEFCCEAPKIDEIEAILQKFGLVANETYLKEKKVR